MNNNTGVSIKNAVSSCRVKKRTDSDNLLNEVLVEFESQTVLNAYLKAAVTTSAETYNFIQPVEIPKNVGNLTVLVPDTNSVLNPGGIAVLELALYEEKDCVGEPLTVYIDEEWQRTRHWEFYLSQSMHTDIGYTNYQGDLPALYTSYINTVKKYIRESDERNSDFEKYRYAIESGWVMGEGYMSCSDADEIMDVVDLIRKGRMEIGAGQFNYTMECFSTEELARAAYYTNRYLRDRLGIPVSTTERMFDNPAFTKSYVDVANSAGIKYGFHSMNGDRSPYWKKKEYDLFYMKGNVAGNKLLIFNAHTYGENYGFSGKNVSDCADNAIIKLNKLISELTSLEGRRRFPYDKFPLHLVPFGDNKQPDDMQIQVANEINRRFSEKGYVYPRIKTAFPNEFFADVEAEYGSLIPYEDGTEENWWNDGWGTTAYESGINKLAGNTIPIAETACSIAASIAGMKYPCNALANAMYRNLVYDEHTWGYHSYDNSIMYKSQWEWKRSNAFGAKVLADKCLGEAVNALAKSVTNKTTPDVKTVYVYNPLNWIRDDVVRVSLPDGFPSAFVLKNGDKSVPYSTDGNTLCFVAKGVPALGYKTYRIEKTDLSTESGTKILDTNIIENEYYKITFANDGTIYGIIDKLTGREIVDSAAEEKFNQYRYYDDHGIPFSNMNYPFDDDKWTLHIPDDAAVAIKENDVCVSARVTSSTFRNRKIVQTITLYKGIARIDIVNEVVKDSLPSLRAIEEAFFTFPFKTAGKHGIRYDLPLGNAAEGEQVYGTSHDWYTVSKWTGVCDTEDGFNIVLASPNTALMQFGERRTGKWSFDYISEKPYLYSYVFNNMWQTNFQGDQPGYADFRYSISTNTRGSDMSENNRFGWETAAPLQAAMADGNVDGNTSGSYLKISTDNVQLTTMKPAEANGEGMILRFAEIHGKETANVTITLPRCADITETDIIENNIGLTTEKSNVIVFDIPAYGFRTYRVVYNTAYPEKVEGLRIISTEKSDGEENLILNAKLCASSSYDGGYLPENLKFPLAGREWASKGESSPWLTAEWDEPVTIGVISLGSRVNGDDLVERAEIYADDSDVPIAVFTGNPLDSDASGNKAVFSPPINIKKLTVRLTGSKNGASVKNNGLSSLKVYKKEIAAPSLSGTYIAWNKSNGAHYYQLFRGTAADFIPGSGNYIGVTDNTGFFDSQVFSVMKHEYYYAVRPVGANGAAGEFSEKVKPTPVEKIVDLGEKHKPSLHAVVREENRIDLWWTPVMNSLPISHYKIVRDGVEIPVIRKNSGTVSHRDYIENPRKGKVYTYQVVAVDMFGNETYSDPVEIRLSL